MSKLSTFSPAQAQPSAPHQPKRKAALLIDTIILSVLCCTYRTGRVPATKRQNPAWKLRVARRDACSMSTYTFTLTTRSLFDVSAHGSESYTPNKKRTRLRPIHIALHIAPLVLAHLSMKRSADCNDAKQTANKPTKYQQARAEAANGAYDGLLIVPVGVPSMGFKRSHSKRGCAKVRKSKHEVCRRQEHAFPPATKSCIVMHGDHYTIRALILLYCMCIYILVVYEVYYNTCSQVCADCILYPLCVKVGSRAFTSLMVAFALDSAHDWALVLCNIILAFP